MTTEISDWNDLDNVRNDLSGDYVLVNDLDSETDGYGGIGDDFEPIGYIDGSGDTSEFAGSFNGDGFSIQNLTVDFAGTSASDVGLFASTDTGALIENVSVSGSVTGGDGGDAFGRAHVGGLVGHHDGGTIQNCVSHVDVTSDGDQVGGLVGDNSDTVTESYATGSVEGDDEVGGLVGEITGTVTESYATGSVEGDENVGGLVGRNAGTVTESYATGSVEGDENVGGLAGDTSVSDEIDSYWDTETSGQSTSDGDATGLTTAEMQGSEAETNMDGFDFTDTWDTVLESDKDTTTVGYPILLSLDRGNQLDAQGTLLSVDITGQITLDETGVATADVIGFNLTNDEFAGKTETDTEGNYTLTAQGTEDGSGDTIAIAVDFDDGTDRYGRLITTVLE